MNTLRKQQQAFARSVTEGIDESYAQTICDYGLTGKRRLSIYQHSITIGLQDALAGVFEVTKKLVGDDYFEHVAKHYVQFWPSTSGNVHEYGHLFPDYLQTVPGLEALPYLPDVARLEWCYHTAFHSPIGEVLNISKLAQVPEPDYEKLKLELSPACFLLRSDFPVLHIWQVNQDDYEGNEKVSLDEGSVDLAIVREGKQIVFHVLDPETYTMLESIANGETFTTACEAMLKVNADCNVGAILQDSVMNRLITGYSLSK